MTDPANEQRQVLRLPKRLRAPDIPAVYKELRHLAGRGPVVLDFGEVEEFDSSTLAFINCLRTQVPEASAANIHDALSRALGALGTRPETAGPAEACPPSLAQRAFASVADRFLDRVRSVGQFLVMLGDEIFHMASYFKDRRGVYPGETWNQLFFMGYRSFPIVCVLIFLVGMTISWTSAAQLRLFNADIYLADLVGLAMLRELVPLMTGVILSGKVGAAVTAELSSMMVLEEVDALKTMGVVPEKYLMVPRLLAITLAIPLLVAMADAVGIFGGIVIAKIYFGTTPSAFLQEMMTVVDWTDFFWGLVKTVVFGWAVVVGAGYKGLTVGRSAGEVGRATTESVVLSITLIILIDCVFAFILY